MTDGSTLAPETTFSIDFNLHMVPAALGLDVPPPAAAAMFGIGEAQLAAYVATVDATVKQIAANLLARPDIAEAVDRLAVPAGGTVMVIGDSITTYRYGYAPLLQALLALRRPNDTIRFFNGGQSGYTSTHALEVIYTQFLAQQPDWLFIMFGVNDCKHFGGPQTKTLVSLEEYRRNMAAIVDAFLTHTAAHLVLLTPTPVVESVVNSNPDFAAMRMTWDNTDIQARAEVIRDLAGRHGLPLVDLVGAFGLDPDPALFLPDGLHPGPAGHKMMLEWALRVLPALQ
ncbi:MAG: GDSL-type esterase/lipase family protein [Ardenticatenaceae bacterium]|nr:GDSL-type esterase/lipase family protein [Ardenticatenaceae bacterium]